MSHSQEFFIQSQSRNSNGDYEIVKSINKCKIHHYKKTNVFQVSTLTKLYSIGIFGGAIVCITGFFITIQPGITAVQSIPIYAGIMSFFATIIITIFKEVSSRYNEKRELARRNWELVFPMMKDSYIPWIQHAKKLKKELEDGQTQGITDNIANRVMFFLCLFYGHRLRFLLKHGGLILLHTKESEDSINQAYDKVKDNLQWAKEHTITYTSELQEYFFKEDCDENPIVFSKFKQLCNTQDNDSEYDFSKAKKELNQWLSKPDNLKNACTSLEDFIQKFEDGIFDFSGREK